MRLRALSFTEREQMRKKARSASSARAAAAATTTARARTAIPSPLLRRAVRRDRENLGDAYCK